MGAARARGHLRPLAWLHGARFALAVLVAPLVTPLLAPHVAAAEEPVLAQGRPHVRARYDGHGAPGCLDASALARGVDAQLGREVFAEPADVVITARAPSSAEVSLTLSTPDGRVLGVRTLRIEGGDCRAIDDELALVIALLVDLPEDEVVLQLAPRAHPADIEAPAPRPTTHVEPALSLAAVGTIDLLPGAALGVRIGGELGLGVVSLEAALLGLLPSTAERDGGGAQLWAWALRVGACAVGALELFRLGGCVALESGGLSVSGRGLDVNLSTIRPWADLSVAARVGLRVDAFEVRLQPGLVVPFVRDVFSYDQGETRVSLFQPAPVAPSLDLVLVVHLGS